MDFAVITMAGHVVADPVSRMGKDNREFATFSIAVNQRFGGQENVSYYDCVAPGYLFQGMQKAGVAKGSAVSVTGTQTVRTYVDREGRNGTSVNIKVLDWRYTGGRNQSQDQPANSSTQGQYSYNGYQAQQPQQAPNNRQAPQGYPPQGQPSQQAPQGYQGQTPQQGGYRPQGSYGYGSVQQPVHIGDEDDLPV